MIITIIFWEVFDIFFNPLKNPPAIHLIIIAVHPWAH